MSGNLLNDDDSARLEIGVGFSLYYLNQYLNRLPPEVVQDETGSKVRQAEELLREAKEMLRKRAEKAVQ